MAEINFYGLLNNGTDNTALGSSIGSGIGFYGGGFGVSVPIGSKQDSTFVTDPLGTDQGAQLNNTKFISSGTAETPGEVSINGLNAINLNYLPNFLCPLNIRFTHTEPVRVQNCKLRIFDRNNIDNHASGVTTYVYEARHPLTSQEVINLSYRGRTENSWYEFDPLDAMTDMPFTASPGMSGLNTNTQDTDPGAVGATTALGGDHESDIHDWYVALSSEPETVGSKTQYGLYFSIEYL